MTPALDVVRQALFGERLGHLDTLDSLLTDPEFTERADSPQRVYRRLALVGRREGGALALARDPARLLTVLEWAAVVDPALFHVAIVHHGVCTATILELGRPRAYLAALLDELDRYAAAGIIMITEEGFGSSHLAPGTRAEFHPRTRSFTLHTPEPQAAKILAHAAQPGVPKIALVYAELFADGRPRGVFPFALRVRDASGTTPGMRITALCEVPALRLDYARATFDGASVPYDGWLRDDAEFTADGRFHDPLGDPSRRLVRSLAFSANASMGTSVGQAAAARAAITLALRYCQRRVTAGRLAPGRGVLAYRTQQSALYSALAEVYATSLLVEQAKVWHRAPRTVAGGSTPAFAPWPAVHRRCALTKAAATSCLARTAATCRLRLGAHGMFAASRLPEYEGMAQVYQAAAGDNLLIRLDTGKALVDDQTYQPAAPKPTARFDPADPGWARWLSAAREAGLQRTLRAHLATAPPHAEPLERWNPILPEVVRLADAHLHTLTLTGFDHATRAADDPGQPALNAALTLYHLDGLIEDLAWHLEHGTLTAQDATKIHQARTDAVTQMHGHSSLLIDALAIPEHRLHPKGTNPNV